MNQRGFANVILVVVIVIFVSVVGYFALVKKSEPVAQQQSTPTSSQMTTSTKTPVSPTPIAKDETAVWNTFTDTRYGFEFQYPATWEATANDSEGQVPDGAVIVRVVNPSRAGKPDTDVPIEQFLVYSQNVTCEGQSIDLGGKTGTDRGWEQGFGLIYYRDLCFRVQGWSITISLSAFDESSQAVMDKILSSFKFTK
jgi:hypothetical protein